MLSRPDNEYLTKRKFPGIRMHTVYYVYCIVLISFLMQIQQLHLCLKNSKCVLLSGESGSGKTVAYSTLASAYQYIGELRALGKSAKGSDALGNARQRKEYPTVDITVLNSAAYTFDEVCACVQYGHDCFYVEYIFLTIYFQLFGFYDTETGHDLWKDGVLTRMFRHIESLEEGRLVTMANASQEVASYKYSIAQLQLRN